MAAEDLMRVVNRQRAGADAVIRWGLNPRRGPTAPDPRRVIQIPDAERECCLALATRALNWDGPQIPAGEKPSPGGDEVSPQPDGL